MANSSTGSFHVRCSLPRAAGYNGKSGWDSRTAAEVFKDCQEEGERVLASIMRQNEHKQEKQVLAELKKKQKEEERKRKKHTQDRVL